MIPFSTLILQGYYQAIGWNEDNSYSQITRSSSALLDFQLPQSLTLQLANSPTPIFFTSYALDALPQLNGSVSYITTSEPLQDIGPSRNLPFKHVVDKFRIYPLPHRPLPKDEVWQGGRRVEGRDYLLYSRLHLPSLHLSGLATTRLTPTLQLHLAFLSHPQPPSARPSSPSGPSHSRQPSETSSSASTTAAAPPGNIMLSLQHDTGRYATEYTYSVQDGMFGLRGLWNFGWKGMRGMGMGSRVEEERARGVDEEEMMEGGLKGRFSAGGEVYFSAKQRSFGISTGLRFSTLPPSSTTAASSQLNPPTTLTLLYNPLIGFLSTAYSAQVSPTIALSSRFGVNVYSYESDLSLGGEWWIGRRRGKRAEEVSTNMQPGTLTSKGIRLDAEQRGREAILEEGDLRGRYSTQPSQGDGEIEGPFASERVYPVSQTRPSPPVARYPTSTASPIPATQPEADERDGILKAKISGNWSIALLYEARIRNCLVSIGIMSDLLSKQKPIRSVGVEVQYFS